MPTTLSIMLLQHIIAHCSLTLTVLRAAIYIIYTYTLQRLYINEYDNNNNDKKQQQARLNICPVYVRLRTQMGGT